MDTEYHALLNNNTWLLVPPPPHANIIRCKWVFKLKYKSDGSVDHYKARLVAKRYDQNQGIDYFETFSPMLKPYTIWIVLTISLTFHQIIRQLDIQNAFLNRELQVQVFMHQPLGYVHHQHPTHVCCLHKEIYGLQQAPRAWFNKLSSSLVTWVSCAPVLITFFFFFFHHTAIGVLIILIYVDDISGTRSSATQIHSFISRLSSVFALRDLGPIIYFLDIKVHRSSTYLHLNQTKYKHDLLKRIAIIEAKSALTLGSLGKPFSFSYGDQLLSDSSLYRRTVGALQYVTISTPDISFAVNKACQFIAHPTSAHSLVVKRILRYLKGTSAHGLLLHSSFPLLFKDTLMPTRHLVQMIIQALVAIASFQDLTWFPGPPLSKRSSLEAVQNRSIGLSHS